MKSLALLHFAYPPNIGGVEILMREHAVILSELGYKVTVLTGNGSSLVPSIAVHTFPQLQSIQNFDPKLQKKIVDGTIDQDFYALSQQIRALLEQQLAAIDTIIIHNMMTVSRNLAFIHAFIDYASAHQEKNIIIYVHDHMLVTGDSIDLSKCHSDFEKTLITTRVPGAKYILISETLKKQLEKVLDLPADNTHIVPNGVNLKNFLEMDEKIWRVFEETHIFEKFPIILSPVNILRRKNILYSLEVVSELKKKYPHICYMLSGQPSKHRDTIEYYQEVQELIASRGLKDNILMLSDYIERSLRITELHDLYNIADAIFYFSLSENFGLPLIEAPLVRTPIFVSDLAVFREVAGDCLEYIDTKHTAPSKTALKVEQAIETGLNRMNYRARTEFNLQTIITKKLVPLL